MARGLEDASTLVVDAAVATVVKAFLRNENEATDDFPLSKGISDKSVSSEQDHDLVNTFNTR